MSVAATTSGNTDGLLALVMVAGQDDTFRQRLAELQQAKADAEEAFQSLRIGNDAKAAYDQVVALKAQADELLARAPADAAAIRAAAEADARKMRDAAAAEIAQAHATAAEIIARADDQAQSLLAGAAEKAKAASDKANAADAAQSAAQAAQEAAQGLADKAQDVHNVAAAERERLAALVVQLRNVLSQV